MQNSSEYRASTDGEDTIIQGIVTLGGGKTDGTSGGTGAVPAV